jgi:DHA1 family multidrug resistance protein-like MFS transporter
MSTQLEELWCASQVETKDVYSVLEGFADDDKRNPRTFSKASKFLIAVYVSLSTFLVTLATSEYTGAFQSLMMVFGVSTEVVVLGLSLMLFGFALGVCGCG